MSWYSWLKFALVAALVVVCAAAGLTSLRVPAALAGLPLVGRYLADTDKVWLLVVWAGAAIAVAVAIRRDSRAVPQPRSIRGARFTTVLAVIAVVVLAILAGWRNESEPHAIADWVGFGGTRLALAGVVSVFAVAIVRVLRRVPRFVTPLVFVVCGMVFVTAAALSPFLPTVTLDNSYTLDELLASASGRVPGFDYVSQYETMLGYPLVLVRLIAPAAFATSPVTFAVVWLLLLQVLTVVFAVWSVARLVPRSLRAIAPLVVIPLTLLIGIAGLAYYADLPMRLFLPMGLLLLLTFTRSLAARVGPRAAAAIVGLLAGVTALNNLDFGIPAALAALVALLVVSTSWRGAAHSLVAFLLGLVLFPALYIAIGSLSGHTFRTAYFLFFVRTFGVNGFMNVDMPVVGLQLTTVALGVIGLVLGSLGARRRTGRWAGFSMTMVYTAAFLLLSLVYYSGRSLTTTLVVGSALIGAVLASQLLVLAVVAVRRLRRSGFRSWRSSDWLVAGATVLLVALPVAAGSSLPHLLTTELSAASLPTAGITPAYLQPDPRPALAKVPRTTRLIGVLGVGGSAWSIMTGVPNADVLLHPSYLAFTSGRQVECEYLATRPGNALLTTPAILADLRRSPLCTKDFAIASARTIVDRSTPATPVRWVLVPRFPGADPAL